MSADYLSYWKPATVKSILGDRNHLLDHAASGQYGRLTRGDTVWIVTTWRGGRLMLLGRIVVDRKTNRAGAARLLGTDDLWAARYHILAARGRAEVVRDVDLSDLAPALRFESARDRLRIVKGAVNGQQLQTMRRLTSASAALLRQRWGEEANVLSTLDHVPGSLGGGFGTPASNREVERAAVAYVTAALKAEGWKVASVEAEQIGYDLICTRGHERRHAEVKGVRGPIMSFIMTDGEVRRAKADPDFWLYLVTEALSEHPKLQPFSGRGMLARFHLVPLAYRAMSAEL